MIPKSTRTQDEKFVSVSAAAEQFSYTKDYLNKLAREGKVVARPDGRRWLFSLESLQNFSALTQAEDVVRTERLRVQRLQEREQMQPVLLSAPTPVILLPTVTLLSGVLTGLFLFLSFSLLSLHVPLGQSITQAAARIGDSVTATVASVPLLPVVMPVTVSTYDAMVVETTERFEAGRGMILLHDSETATSSDSGNWFSDPVSITHDSPTGGVVEVLVDGTISVVPFVSLPVSE